MTNSVKKEEEGLKYFSRFLMLFDKAAPVIRYIANLEDLKHGEIPVSPYVLLESNLTLKMILQALRKLPESRDKDFSDIKREFDTALTNCIRAAEATEKYVAMGRSEKAKMLLGTIINSSVMAHEYIESVSVKVELYSKKIHLQEAVDRPAVEEKKEPEKLPVKAFIKEKQKTNRKIKSEERKRSVQRDGAQGVVNNAADYIEQGLDKIGDILVAPFTLIEKAIKKSRKNKSK